MMKIVKRGLVFCLILSFVVICLVAGGIEWGTPPFGLFLALGMWAALIVALSSFKE